MSLLTPGSGTAPEAGIADLAPPTSPGKDAWRRFRRNRVAVISLGFLILMVLLAIFADVVCKYSPYDINTKERLIKPFDGDHWFGTDKTGRDLFAQIIFGIRISLKVGFIVSFAAAVIGTIVGALAGYFGGWLDTLTMRGIDIFLSIPYIILTVALIGLIGRGVNALIIALALVGWFVDARVVRATFLSLKEQEFVQAARALGYKPMRIIFRHILPNAIQPVIVYTTLGIGGAILSEAALSFLGIGVLPPEPSWGLLVSQNKSLLPTEPHLIFFPGAAIFITVLAFVMLGDGVRDALDPKMKL